MYHSVRIYKDKCGVHVSTQTVAIFLDYGTCTRVYVCTCYVPGIIYTLRRCHDSRRQYDTPTYIIVVYSLVLRLVAACCRISAFVCTGQRLVRARVALWSTPGLASMKHLEAFGNFPFGYSRDVFFHLLVHRLFSFFQAFFLQPELTLDLYETKKTTARLIRTCHACAHTYIHYVYISCDTTTIQQQWGPQEAEIQYTAVRVHVPGTYYAIHTLRQQTATRYSSNSATAASLSLIHI